MSYGDYYNMWDAVDRHNEEVSKKYIEKENSEYGENNSRKSNENNYSYGRQ